MRFSEIPGLAETRKTLIDSVKSNHIAHAQLFVGAEGALNLPLALAYATYIHCQNKQDDDSCGTCPACSKSLKYIHPDTHFVFPLSNVKGDKDEERFKAEILKSWRTFLLEQPFGDLDDWTTSYGGEDKQALISREESREIVKALSLKPFESQFKIMIIWQPEFMHPSAANGILKILEEPAAHTYFILVTNAADRLLPTIVSRTQIITVPLLADKEVENYLFEKKSIERKRAATITQLAEGNFNLAFRLSENEEDDSAPMFIDWMRACFKKSFGSLVAMSEEFHALDKLRQRNIMHYGMNMMRESLLKSAGANELHRVQGEELKFINDFSKVMNVYKIEKSYSLMNDAAYHLERNGSAKMIFLDLSLQLSKTLNP
ncbi:MAG TPA: DNA polymerase III subunit [Cyclobacteriaceae bacterium]|nr:DNA polymerase III subunit [Cyclobacteriaceae bacterium]HMV10423.1 DNA polymerase III subunit [Cyclobacteriaceae bacterium]HMX01346.1 DNA polymerase III subunit [Cyclobacteriaceae bacterium]HMX50383.1 DNA polymerase III subunit [Cyclobacteriaceae bacterium]HMY92452.1 DNA polymerase III subunit [Cyclobacteriaceae bacterium]